MQIGGTGKPEFKKIVLDELARKNIPYIAFNRSLLAILSQTIVKKGMFDEFDGPALRLGH